MNPKCGGAWLRAACPEWSCSPMGQRGSPARGIFRPTPEVIAAKEGADLDAFAPLQNPPFLVADRPTTGGAAVFGLLAPTCLTAP